MGDREEVLWHSRMCVLTRQGVSENTQRAADSGVCVCVCVCVYTQIFSIIHCHKIFNIVSCAE